MSKKQFEWNYWDVKNLFKFTFFTTKFKDRHYDSRKQSLYPELLDMIKMSETVKWIGMRGPVQHSKSIKGSSINDANLKGWRGGVTK